MGKEKKLEKILKDIEKMEKDLSKLKKDIIELASQPDPPGSGG